MLWIKNFHLNINLKVIGSRVLDVVGYFVEATRGCEDDNSWGWTSIHFKLEISDGGAVEGCTALPEAAVVESSLNLHAMSSLSCSDCDLETSSRAVLDDDGGWTVAEGRSVDTDFGKNSIVANGNWCLEAGKRIKNIIK